MATIEIPKWRQESTVLLHVKLKDNGVAVDWSGLQNVKAYMYSDAQRIIAGKCDVEEDGSDGTVLNVTYPATKPQYLGVNSLLVRCKYYGREKSYDVPVGEFVERTAQATGVTVIEDPEMDVEIEVEEVSTSLLDGAIAAALDAAVAAEEAAAAAEEAAAAAEHMVDIHQGPPGPAGVTEVEATIDNNSGTPEVEVSLENQKLTLAFKKLKGPKGNPGDTPTWEDFSAEDKAAIAQAAAGSVVDNNLDTDDLAATGNNKIQFANRVYNAQQPNMKGYKILRKGASFASQVTDTNTIYEIRYDFALDGGAVTIPEGCVLKFNGGKVSNGSIAFNGCALDKNDADNIFANIISFSGNVSGYFTPENVSYGINGDCFSALLTYLKATTVLLKVNTMSLTSDTDLQGVWLDATKFILNGYTLRIGGGWNKITDVAGAYGKGQNQSILAINTNGNRSGRVIVGAGGGQDLHLGHYNGKLEFVVEANSGGISYSSFYLDSISSIELSAASGVTGAWINTNRFVLNRVVSFVVKNSLTFFNNNQIQMGCFEGAFTLRLEIGDSNSFTDIRGEATSSARGQLYLGEATYSNTVGIMNYPTMKIYDYGRGNVVRNNVLYDSRLLDKANISLQDLKKNLPSRIMGMTLSQDGTYMVPSSSYDVIPGFESYFARYYQSGFIPYKKRMTIYAVLDVLAKNESGLGFTYELYDANYEPVYVTKTGGAAVPLAKLTTAQNAYNNLTAGTFFNAFAMLSNYRPGDAHTVDNSYVLFQFDDQSALNAIAAGDTQVATSLAAVKYITISVVGNTYFYSFNSQLLSVGVSIYEPGFKVKAFNSDVETP